MSQYGAWVGRDGKAPPYPTYKEMSVQQSSTLPAPSAEYIKGFNKDYDAFFNGWHALLPPPVDSSTMLSHCLALASSIHHLQSLTSLAQPQSSQAKSTTGRPLKRRVTGHTHQAGPSPRGIQVRKETVHAYALELFTHTGICAENFQKKPRCCRVSE